VCDLETSRMGVPYIYDISHLRVNLFSWSVGWFKFSAWDLLCLSKILMLKATETDVQADRVLTYIFFG